MTRDGITETLGDRMRDLVDFGSDRASDIKDKLSDAKDAAVAGASTALDKTSKLIKQHPFIAIGVALGLGFLVMRMVRRT